jgi:hypothetical protein
MFIRNIFIFIKKNTSLNINVPAKIGVKLDVKFVLNIEVAGM